MGKTVKLSCVGITITNGVITSDLHEEGDSDLCHGALDGVESLVLAHHMAGIDVTTPAYLEGVETAICRAIYPHFLPDGNRTKLWKLT
jgi:hypothetical protein